MSNAAAVAPGADAPKKKGKLIPILLGAVILAGGAGGGYVYMQKSQGEAEVEEAPKKKAPPVFINLDPFTVNLADRDRYLQLGVVFEVETPEVGEAIKAQMPVLRSRVLMLLTSKTADSLVPAEGKAKLVEELMDIVLDVLPGKETKKGKKKKADDDKGVIAVHFSGFVIQ